MDIIESEIRGIKEKVQHIESIKEKVRKLKYSVIEEIRRAHILVQTEETQKIFAYEETWKMMATFAVELTSDDWKSLLAGAMESDPRSLASLELNSFEAPNEMKSIVSSNLFTHPPPIHPCLKLIRQWTVKPNRLDH